MTPLERALDDHRAALEAIRLLRRDRKGGLDTQVEIAIQRRIAAEALARAKGLVPDAAARPRTP